jgi:hypothetical protein
VEAINDLPRLWCALTGRVRIEAIAIAVDDLDFRMLLEPVCHSVCRTVCQQIHHTAALQVHDNGAEFCTLPPSPLIDTSDPDCGSFGPGPGVLLETPQDRGVACPAGPSSSPMGARRAMAEQPDDLRQSVGLTRRRGGNSWKTFGEDPAIAPLVPAAPATHSHPDRNRRSLSGEIANHV